MFQYVAKDADCETPLNKMLSGTVVIAEHPDFVQNQKVGFLKIFHSKFHFCIIVHLYAFIVKEPHFPPNGLICCVSTNRDCFTSFPARETKITAQTGLT